MGERLLANLRTRRQLVREAERRFQALQFGWQSVSSSELLYCAAKSCDSADTPGLEFRLLVQCVPYETIPEVTLPRLCGSFREQPTPFQYCVLVHQTALYAHDKQRMLERYGGHVLVMQPDEIDRLPVIFALQSAGPR